MIIRAGNKAFDYRSVPSNQWALVRTVLSAVLTLIFLFTILKRTLHGNSTDPYAYVFYATSNLYACSALVNAVHIQQTLKSPHPIYVIANDGVNEEFVAAFRRHGISVITSPTPHLNSITGDNADYYSSSLLKLMAFGIYNYVPHLRRIIVMDSDQLVLRNLDHLFHLPSVPLAAPRAYWLPDHTVSITSALMVIEQSPRTWARVEAGLRGISPGFFDMDLVQQLFGETVMILPGNYATLNSHWEAWDLPGWFTGESSLETIADFERGFKSADDKLRALWDDVAVMHFTAKGKPWTSSFRTARGDFNAAHWLLGRQFEMWKLGLDGIAKNSTMETVLAKKVPPSKTGPRKGADELCGFSETYHLQTLWLDVEPVSTESIQVPPIDYGESVVPDPSIGSEHESVPPVDAKESGDWEGSEDFKEPKSEDANGDDAKSEAANGDDADKPFVKVDVVTVAAENFAGQVVRPTATSEKDLQRKDKPDPWPEDGKGAYGR